MWGQREHHILLVAGSVLIHLAGGGVVTVRFPTVRPTPAGDVFPTYQHHRHENRHQVTERPQFCCRNIDSGEKVAASVTCQALAA